MPKIVFIQPKVGYQGASYWDSLGIGYIISYLKMHNQSLQTSFYSSAFDSDETILKGCETADYAAFGCTSPQMKHALSLARKIKNANPNCKTIFGGWHPTALPEQTLLNQEVDYVVSGEGEEGTWRILSKNLAEGECLIHSKPYRNLDFLPWPDRNAIKADRHIKLAYSENGKRITSIQGGRGCPFRCIFCSEHLMNRTVRRRTPRKVVDELEVVSQEFNIDYFKFVDPEINASVGWVFDFCREVEERNLGVEFEANLHASLTTEKMLSAMAKAGFTQVDIGVETGSPRILRDIGKGVTVEQIRQAFKWSQEAGLQTRGYFMVGFPNESMEDVEATFKLADELNPNVAGMTILCPFPNTKLYDPSLYANVDWSTADEYGNSLPKFPSRLFSNEELHDIQRRFQETFKQKLCYRLKQSQ